MSKKTILIVIIIIVIVGIGYWNYQATITQELAAQEKACLDSGGEVRTSLCCQTISDFPNLCLVGPCGCSPENSHEIKICDCGEDKCFDGNSCVEFSLE